jgi:hypothetical protein
MLRGCDWFVRALRVVRDVRPDAYIGAGAVRTVVWDVLHGREPGLPKDVDVVWFDRSDPDLGERVERALAERVPDLAWDAKNQAHVHEWYPRRFGLDVEPLASIEEAVGTWPETSTCVAVRLRDDDGIDVIAPYGFHDLFGLVLRRNPTRVTEEEYRARVRRYVARWPCATVIEPARGAGRARRRRSA